MTFILFFFILRPPYVKYKGKCSVFCSLLFVEMKLNTIYTAIVGIKVIIIIVIIIVIHRIPSGADGKSQIPQSGY